MYDLNTKIWIDPQQAVTFKKPIFYDELKLARSIYESG